MSTSVRDETVEKAKQLFRFLKAFAERRTPTRLNIDQHEWRLFLRPIQDLPNIRLGEVFLNDEDRTPDEQATSAALFSVRRPDLTEAPPPPEVLHGWLDGSWKSPQATVVPMLERRTANPYGEAIVTKFEDDPQRTEAYENWKSKWEAWAERELPLRETMRLYEQLYGVFAQIRQQSEQLELVLADGILRKKVAHGTIHHPILLQRVELEFDADHSEIRLLEADHPPEIYAPALDAIQETEAYNYARKQLEERGFHPLEDVATSQFFRRVANQLGAHGQFLDEPSKTFQDYPTIERNPLLILRKRVPGFSEAFGNILEELESGDVELTPAISRVLGIEPPAQTVRAESVDYDSPWAEPEDILLSKPANAEQIAIARALERQGTVQVQGPPGTGKSHTIANLIGHLVAQGKRVLVTSHTTKALSVLRGHIAEPIQPLAVAVLENDMAGKVQLERSVTEILERLGTPREKWAQDVSRLTEQRRQLNSQIDSITTELRQARESEYREIILGSESFAPSEAARWIMINRVGNDWIPGHLSNLSPLPLSEAEFAELYALNELLTIREESEIGSGLPSREQIPSPETMREWVEALNAPANQGGSRYWPSAPQAKHAGDLDTLGKRLNSLQDEFAAMQPWEKVIVKAGRTGGGDQKAWEDFAQQLEAVYEQWDNTKAQRLENDVVLPKDVPIDDLIVCYNKIIDRIQSAGKLGLWPLTNPDCKRVIKASQCNGAEPSSQSHFEALKLAAGVVQRRQMVASRWKRQAVPAGLADFESLGAEPERVLLDYAGHIRRRLEFWAAWRGPIQALLNSVDFQWKKASDEALTSLNIPDPFDREVKLLVEYVRPWVAQRRVQVTVLMAERQLTEVLEYLRTYEGEVSLQLRRAIENRDTDGFAIAFRSLEDLVSKAKHATRRHELLGHVSEVAPDWAQAIKTRTSPHDQSSLPGNVSRAWKWAQLHQELERRASLDERELERKLEHSRRSLQKTTAKLVEAMAWKAQVERVGHEEKQDLNHWSQIQKKIGKGKGRRAPKLIAEARMLLQRSRNAVPVWIMPLSRVAESFRSGRHRFDVVILDEASQCDMLGLLAWHLGDRVVVVGDNKQVNPLDIGTKLDDIDQLIDQFLRDIPGKLLYDGTYSIYDAAEANFGNTIRLREHFRCVPAIIEYSNQLSYNGEIRPLRNPANVPLPHVAEWVAIPELNPGERRKINEAEAKMTVALLKAMADSPLYKGKTFGAITLLGDEQAKLIMDLAISKLSAQQIEALNFISGNSAQFQGDERDIIILNMVSSPEGRPLRILTDDRFRQRYNVAASRAKDQLWLIHSLDPDLDLKGEDLRRGLIAHVRDPDARERVEREKLSLAESPFEEEVIKRLLDAGHAIEPQVSVGNYRIDLVVGAGKYRVAVECDGDRFHGVDKIPADMARQAVLERAGWKFIRIRGSRFYRDPEETMQWVFAELKRYKVEPVINAPTSAMASGEDLRNELELKARQIMKRWGWLESGEEDVEGTADEAEVEFSAVSSDDESHEVEAEIWFESDEESDLEGVEIEEWSDEDDASLQRLAERRWGLTPKSESDVQLEFELPEAASNWVTSDAVGQAPYIEFHGRIVADPREGPKHLVANGLARIVEQEGPILAKRAMDIYLRRLGIRRMGPEIKEHLTRALKHAIRHDGVEAVDERQNGQTLDLILRKSGSPAVVPRLRGPRDFSEIPPSEIVFVAKQLAAVEAMVYGSEEHMRALLECFDLKRLTEGVRRELREILDLSFDQFDQMHVDD